MKKLLKITLAGALAVAALASCSHDEVYKTQVIRDFTMTLDGEPWNIYYNTKNMPLFIYYEDGSFFANYSTSYRFSLEDGSYRIFATNESDNITPPTNLDDQIINQDPEGKLTFAISDPVVYKAGDPLKLALKTRTGKLRLRSMDVKPDKSYSFVRATVTTPISSYSVAKGAPIVGELTSYQYAKEASGGIGYSQEVNLIGSETEKVKVTIEYLDADSTVLNKREFDEAFSVLPNQQTDVEFMLNDADAPVIVDYKVTIGQLNWKENDIFPSVKLDVPEGYRYVEPSENLGDVFKEMMADASIDKIQIFLKASTAYTIADKVMEGCTKPFIIKGQVPGYGQDKASVAFHNISMNGNIDFMRFENVELKPAKDRIFNLRTEEFHVGEIAFDNCIINNWSGTIWTSNVSKDNVQVVDHVKMNGCRLTNLTTSNPLWNVSTRKVAPINNWEFTNTLFHGRNFGTKTAILGGLSKTPGNVSVLVEGCTFVDTRGVDCIYFDIDGAAASSTTITVRNNTAAGVKSGVGTWFKIGASATVNSSDNTRAKGYEMKSWGVDTPSEGSLTYEEILSQLNL